MSVVSRIVKQLAKRIANGAYPPGSRFPTRAQLISEFTVARATVDKAIAELRSQGLVSSTQGSGTFVLDSSQSEGQVYLILNTETRCPEASSFHDRIHIMLAQNKEQFVVMGTHELEKHFAKLLQSSHNRVIWSRPSLNSYDYIASLKRKNISQILINRPLPSYNYISTGTKAGLKKVFQIVEKQNPQARMGLIASPLDIEESFLAEREIYFHELVVKFGFVTRFCSRMDDKNSDEILAHCAAALDRVDEIDYLFIPDFKVLPFVISMAHGKGIQLGKDLNLITIDLEEPEHGVISMRQDWESMLRSALAWAQSKDCPEVHSLIEPSIIIAD